MNNTFVKILLSVIILITLCSCDNVAHNNVGAQKDNATASEATIVIGSDAVNKINETEAVIVETLPNGDIPADNPMNDYLGEDYDLSNIECKANEDTDVYIVPSSEAVENISYNNDVPVETDYETAINSLGFDVSIPKEFSDIKYYLSDSGSVVMIRFNYKSNIYFVRACVSGEFIDLSNTTLDGAKVTERTLDGIKVKKFEKDVNDGKYYCVQWFDAVSQTSWCVSSMNLANTSNIDDIVNKLCKKATMREIAPEDNSESEDIIEDNAESEVDKSTKEVEQ